MKIVIVSDLHGNLIDIPEGDIFISCGDEVPTWNHEIWFQRQWINDTFIPWLSNIPCKHKVFIAGNHSLYFHNDNIVLNLPENCHYLNESDITIDGLKIYGTPWTPFFCDWAFGAYEKELTERYSKMPNDTDILVCHGPPFGILDQISRVLRSEHLGARPLTKLLVNNHFKQLKLMCFGHIHGGFGSLIRDNINFINASILDEQYHIANKPTIIEV